MVNLFNPTLTVLSDPSPTSLNTAPCRFSHVMKDGNARSTWGTQLTLDQGTQGRTPVLASPHSPGGLPCPAAAVAIAKAEAGETEQWVLSAVCPGGAEKREAKVS